MKWREKAENGESFYESYCKRFLVGNRRTKSGESRVVLIDRKAGINGVYLNKGYVDAFELAEHLAKGGKLLHRR